MSLMMGTTTAATTMESAAYGIVQEAVSGLGAADTADWLKGSSPMPIHALQAVGAVILAAHSFVEALRCADSLSSIALEPPTKAPTEDDDWAHMGALQLARYSDWDVRDG